MVDSQNPDTLAHFVKPKSSSYSEYRFAVSTKGDAILYHDELSSLPEGWLQMIAEPMKNPTDPEMCFFCERAAGTPEAAVAVSLYGYLRSRPSGQVGTVQVQWKTLSVEVPRCCECHEHHDQVFRVNLTGIVGGFLVGVLLGGLLILVSGESMDQPGWLYGIGVAMPFFTLIVGVGATTFWNNRTSPHPIKPKLEHFQFPRLAHLLRLGWHPGVRPQQIEINAASNTIDEEYQLGLFTEIQAIQQSRSREKEEQLRSDFIKSAAEGPAEVCIPIASISKLHWQLNDVFKAKGFEITEICDLISNKLFGLCPYCTAISSGQGLALLAAADELSLSVSFGGSSEGGNRLGKGYCRTAGCESRCIHLFFRPDESPALVDRLATLGVLITPASPKPPEVQSTMNLDPVIHPGAAIVFGPSPKKSDVVATIVGAGVSAFVGETAAELRKSETILFPGRVLKPCIIVFCHYIPGKQRQVCTEAEANTWRDKFLNCQVPLAEKADEQLYFSCKVNWTGNVRDSHITAMFTWPELKAEKCLAFADAIEQVFEKCRLKQET